MILRDYQKNTITALYRWFGAHDGNPCIVLPTGAGKSHIIAEICKDSLQNWPETRILVLTHVKELIEQNSKKMRLHWPNAPVGVYSAGMRMRELGEPITFAGIQSVRNKGDAIGHIDLCIVDECHLISHKNEGGYRSLITKLTSINSNMKVIGLSATPYRLGHGLITDNGALFSNPLIEPVTIEELIYKGFLAPLRSKLTKTILDVSGVHKRGGEYIESELQDAVDTDANNKSVVQEVIAIAGDRKAWLFFCSGVNHAEHISTVLNENGIPSACITGETPKKQREDTIKDFKAGKLRALTNANVLTTGFDYPDIDLIAMLRPTLSPGLYVQMAGRGLRPKSHTDHCLVLDFAGVIQTHGPITAVKIPDLKSSGDGEAPVKVCDNCHELCHISVQICPVCGNPFPITAAKELKLCNDDIMGLDGTPMTVSSWVWRKHISKASGNEMLACTYYGELSDPPITEYFPLLNGGYAGDKSLRQLHSISLNAGTQMIDTFDMELAAYAMNNGIPPIEIEYKKDGKYFRVIKRSWNENRA